MELLYCSCGTVASHHGKRWHERPCKHTHARTRTQSIVPCLPGRDCSLGTEGWGNGLTSRDLIAVADVRVLSGRGFSGLSSACTRLIKNAHVLVMAVLSLLLELLVLCVCVCVCVCVCARVCACVCACVRQFFTGQTQLHLLDDGVGTLTPVAAPVSGIVSQTSRSRSNRDRDTYPCPRPPPTPPTPPPSSCYGSMYSPPTSPPRPP